MLDQPWWRFVDAARVAQVVLVATEDTTALEQVEQAATDAAGRGALAHLVLLTAASAEVGRPGTAQVDGGTAALSHGSADGAVFGDR